MWRIESRSADWARLRSSASAGENRLGDDRVKSPLELANAGTQVLGDVSKHNFGHLDSTGSGFHLENRLSRHDIRWLDPGDHACQKSRHQLVGEPWNLSRVLVSRQHDRCSLVVKSVERVEEFGHRRPFGRQELNVVDDQSASAAKPSAETTQGSGTHRVQKTVRERLGRELNDLQFRVKLLELVVDSFQKMGLSQADSLWIISGLKARPAVRAISVAAACATRFPGPVT